MRDLILGGARSGKSRFAEDLARQTQWPVTYLATAQAWDDEMAQRIELHRQQRPAHWQLCEEPLALAEAMALQAAPGRVLLVDCLTLWLTNLLMLDDDERLARERDAFLDGLGKLPGHILLVSNETGLGVVPMGALSRRFVDQSGWLHQAVAARCERVRFMVAGLPMLLKGET